MPERMIFDRCIVTTGLGIGPCCVGRDAGHLKIKGKPCRPYQQSLPAAVLRAAGGRNEPPVLLIPPLDKALVRPSCSYSPRACDPMSCW